MILFCSTKLFSNFLFFTKTITISLTHFLRFPNMCIQFYAISSHIQELLFLKNLFILFTYFCLCSVFVATHGLSLVTTVGATLSCGARASHCGDFSCCGAQALDTRASVVVALRLSSCDLRALEHRLSSCGTRAQLLCSMWDRPRRGIKPMSPALAGGFSTTAPPGKPLGVAF